MINEKKLIEEIRRHPLEFAENDIGIGLRLVTDIIKNQPKVGEWVPCSERMPREHEVNQAIYDPLTIESIGTKRFMKSDLVLVTAVTENGEEFTTNDHTVDGKWTNYTVVTAWKPLPKPYKPD